MDQQTREPAFHQRPVTEHFVLQSARGALIGEMVGRASVYLGAVSSGLIAVGLAAQTATSLPPLLAVVLPAVVILGELTFLALLRDSLQTWRSYTGCSASAATTRGLLPDAEQFLDPPGQDNELAVELATVCYAVLFGLHLPYEHRQARQSSIPVDNP